MINSHVSPPWAVITNCLCAVWSHISEIQSKLPDDYLILYFLVPSHGYDPCPLDYKTSVLPIELARLITLKMLTLKYGDMADFEHLTKLS